MSERERLIRRFAQLRASTYALVADKIRPLFVHSVRLGSVTPEAIATWETVWKPAYAFLTPEERQIRCWDWAQLAQDAYTVPAAFHLAIWCGAQLCGLAVGRPSKARRRLTIAVLEGAPYPHPLRGKILDLVLITAEVYGRSLGSQLLRLEQPIKPMLAVYQRRGFTLAGDIDIPTYCERRIDYGENVSTLR